MVVQAELWMQLDGDHVIVPREVQVPLSTAVFGGEDHRRRKLGYGVKYHHREAAAWG